MKELTEENYNYLTPNFEGIIVSIPTTIGYNADLYVYGNKIKEDNKLEISCMAYNMEDGAINGFSYFGNTDFQSIFRDFKYMKHYEFENLSEFCNWYLHKDDKLHESIDNFIKDTQKFYDTPKDLNDKLITERIERRNKEHYFMQKYGFNPYEEEPPEKLCYWDIYNDENCDGELKRIMESKWPKLKELLEQLKDQANPVLAYYKHGDGSENNLYSPNEIRDKINPGWNTRRERLKDVLKLLELRDRRQSTLETLFDAKEPSLVEHLQNQLDRDEQRIEDFLNEVII